MDEIRRDIIRGRSYDRQTIFACISEFSNLFRQQRLVKRFELSDTYMDRKYKNLKFVLAFVPDSNGTDTHGM